MRACTVVTRSRLAHARALGESYEEHHPGQRLLTLLVDDVDHSIVDEGLEIVRPDALDLAADELSRMAAMYGPLQLCCALKPWLLLHVLEDDGSCGVYLDADIEIHADLRGVAELAERRDLLLTPHLTEPPPREARAEESGRFLSGSFNAGFLAVGSGARPFLRWWRDRLARFCIHAPDKGYFDDQRWLDLAPVYFPHHVLRDPGFNVGFWNVASRPIEWSGTSYLAAGERLRFFHFGGFDVVRPHLLSRWLGSNPHTLLSTEPALARLCHGYAERVRRHGHERYSVVPYGYQTLPDGEVLDAALRTAFRTATLRAEDRLHGDPPNPFEHGGRALRSWLAYADREGFPSPHAPPPRLVHEHMNRAGRTVGMSWTSERAYCQWYASRLATGDGEIVELGCWLGSLTATLAMGLRDNHRPATRRIRVHAHDAFRWTEQMEEVVAGTALAGRFRPGDSFRAAFEERIAPWRDRVDVHEADLRTARWAGGEIQFLLVDAMKSFELAGAIARGYFPHLIPGRGLIMHQDFAHFETYWIHVLDYRLRDYLEPVYDIPWASGVVLRLTGPVPDEILERPLTPDTIDADELEQAFELAYSFVSERKRPDVAAAKIKALVDRDELERARAELARWSRYRHPASTDLPIVARLLADAGAST